MKKYLALALCIVMLLSVVSCGTPSNPQKAKAKFEKKDYTVIVVDNELALKLVGLDGLNATLTATKKEDKGIESCSMYFFDSASQAKDAVDKITKLVADSSTIKRSGKVVYAGTDKAVKIIK